MRARGWCFTIHCAPDGEDTDGWPSVYAQCECGDASDIFASPQLFDAIDGPMEWMESHECLSLASAADVEPSAGD